MENYSKRFNSTTDYKLAVITPKHTNMNTSNYNNIISSDKHSKTLSSKTPNKTPLRLSSNKKRTPNTMTNDRYIPNRTSSNMEASFHILVSRKDQENLHEPNINNSNISNNNMDNIKRKLINDTCQGVVSDKAKVLNLHSKQPDQDQVFTENLKIYGTCLSGNPIKKATQRQIQTVPEKILDAPEYLNDFYLNLIDWSSTNNLAVALNKDLYIWNAATKDIYQLFSMDENSRDYISSVSWIQKGNILAVGNSKNTIELWDVNKKVCLRQMKSHKNRVGALAWNSHQLSSGSRTGEIHSHDVRIAQHHTSTLKLHSQEVCGLKWSPDYRYLASGANDNLVGIWESTKNSTSSQSAQEPMKVFREHNAAVKALAWCPWQHNIIATGGGTSDKHIKLWNIHTGNIIHNIDADSQVSSLYWSNTYKELISSHGNEKNQLTIWKYPEMSKTCDLMGHTNRILGMSMSPDEEFVVSIGADETLRFWKCFAIDEKTKKSKEAANAAAKNTAAHKSGLGRCIR
jgi:cell division cycle protein 20 (cofactor of APC complex)